MGFRSSYHPILSSVEPIVSLAFSFYSHLHSSHSSLALGYTLSLQWVPCLHPIYSYVAIALCIATIYLTSSHCLTVGLLILVRYVVYRSFFCWVKLNSTYQVIRCIVTIRSFFPSTRGSYAARPPSYAGPAVGSGTEGPVALWWWLLKYR